MVIGDTYNTTGPMMLPDIVVSSSSSSSNNSNNSRKKRKTTTSSSTRTVVLIKKEKEETIKNKNKKKSKTHHNNSKTSPYFSSKGQEVLSSKPPSRPTPEECYYVTQSLSLLHPEVISNTTSLKKEEEKKEKNQQRKTLLESCGMRDDITDAIISTMLSQNTTDSNSKAAFRNLKTVFPTWDKVIKEPNIDKLENSIRVAGLAKTRAERIFTMLQTVNEEYGSPSLQYIQSISSTEEIKMELSRFKGLGPKTISCVLLFALKRPEFPVDTHVLRITKSMGWMDQLSSNPSREDTYEHLNQLVPNELKMDLHCLLVQHGKCCHRCAARNRPQFPPKDGTKLDCPLRLVSSWKGFVPPELSNIYGTSSNSCRTDEIAISISVPKKEEEEEERKVKQEKQQTHVKVEIDNT